MDKLRQAAINYEKLLNKKFVYTLENDITLEVVFLASHFHHLAGLQKLKDIARVTKTPHDGLRNAINTRKIFSDISKGQITLDDIKKSEYFSEIEDRLNHFNQLNALVEFEKVIVDFDRSLLGYNSHLWKADYVLYKNSNTNEQINLFLGGGEGLDKKVFPLTFIISNVGQYTNGQKVLKILNLEITKKRHKSG